MIISFWQRILLNFPFSDEIPIHECNYFEQFIMGIQCVPLNKIIFNTLKVTKISAYGNFAKIKPD